MVSCYLAEAKEKASSAAAGRGGRSAGAASKGSHADTAADNKSQDHKQVHADAQAARYIRCGLRLSDLHTDHICRLPVPHRRLRRAQHHRTRSLQTRALLCC